jgi:hypothetical protein
MQKQISANIPRRCIESGTRIQRGQQDRLQPVGGSRGKDQKPSVFPSEMVSLNKRWNKTCPTRVIFLLSKGAFAMPAARTELIFVHSVL